MPPSTYTKISKPTNASYTNINSSGKEGFDDVSVSFDNFGTFFDGVSNAAYTNVGKPTGSTYTNISKPV